MIDAAYVQRMSRYNRWQNENLYSVADRLPDADRRQNRGAFFGSIHATLSHLLWGDRIWMSRFANWPKPDGGIKDSVALFDDWDNLRRERVTTDSDLIGWADSVDPQWIAGDMTYFSGAVGKEITRPMWVLVTHLFNHQTHHRGQVHAMLTQAGGKPHDTDLPFMPE
jgi:uncharacterized damage-inducible protein DinB